MDGFVPSSVSSRCRCALSLERLQPLGPLLPSLGLAPGREGRWGCCQGLHAKGVVASHSADFHPGHSTSDRMVVAARATVRGEAV